MNKTIKKIIEFYKKIIEAIKNADPEQIEKEAKTIALLSAIVTLIELTTIIKYYLHNS